MAATFTSGRQPDNLIGLLDLGTSKAVCLIIAAAPGRGLDGVRVLGFGHQPSRGLKAGVVVELDAAELSVRAAVAQAERMAGIEVEDVLLAVACGRLKSSTFVADTKVAGPVAADRDVDRLMAAGRSYAERDGRTLLHMNAIAYRLDGGAAMADPRGFAGRTLSADLYAVTGDDAPLRNLLHVAERAYLSAAGLMPAPLASGIASTTHEERQLGVLAIDMGAGATTLSMFAEGHALFVDVIPVGGNHVTFDLARALSVPVAEAERIKTLYGRVGVAASDDNELIAQTLARNEVPALRQVSKGRVREIVHTRMAALVGQLADRIERSGIARYAMQRVVLTGGASQLLGLPEFAAAVFGTPVRGARVEPVGGLPASFCSPAFAAAVGLVHAALDPTAGVRRQQRDVHTGSYLRRMGQWLRESL